MSSVAAESKSPLRQIAMPATVVLLVGLSLAYTFRGDGAQVPASSSMAEPIATPDQMQPSPVDAVNNRLLGLATRGRTRGKTNANDAVFADRASGLAQLHKNMINVRAQTDQRDRMVVNLENQHRAEPVDAVWSAQSEVSILSASVKPVMIQAGFKPQDVTTDCRSRTCRISARFTSSGDAQDWSDRLLTQMGRTLSQVKVTVLPQPDASFEVRIYGLRK